jgi:hypothetical protein
LRPRYLQADFIASILVAMIVAVFAFWGVSSLDVPPIYAVLGYALFLWILMDMLVRRIMREHAREDERSRSKRVRTPTGESIIWPPLPTDPLMRGRAATDADVSAGRAVFVMTEVTGNPGRAVDIVLPQYAWSDETPVAVIQAETDGETTLFGIFDFESLTLDFAEDRNVKLLGVNPPSDVPST